MIWLNYLDLKGPYLFISKSNISNVELLKVKSFSNCNDFLLDTINYE